MPIWNVYNHCIRFAGPDGIESVKRHPFFASISWEALLAKRVAPPFKPTVVSDEAFHFDTAFTSKTPKGKSINGIFHSPL